jgi:arginase
MVSKVAMIGVPMDLGGGRRGVDMGPSALRIAGLEDGVRRLGLEYEDRGNVPVPQPESRVPLDPKARFLAEIVRCCKRLRGRVERVLDEGAFPLVVGGDHTAATTRSRSARSPRSARTTTVSRGASG